MFDAPTLVIIAATFLLAGTVKGVIGMGFPTICVGVMTAAIDLPTAMALSVVPSFATNLWQAASGGQMRVILRRLWLFYLMAAGTVWIGAIVFARMNTTDLATLLGILLVLYGIVSLAGFRLSFSRRAERLAGPLFGAANGILTGMTGTFVVPGLMYLQALKLDRNSLLQAMGVLFVLSTVALAGGLQQNGLLTADLGLASALGLVPSLAGMILGTAIRRRLSEARFRLALFAGLILLGAYIVARTAL